MTAVITLTASRTPVDVVDIDVDVDLALAGDCGPELVHLADPADLADTVEPTPQVTQMDPLPPQVIQMAPLPPQVVQMYVQLDPPLLVDAATPQLTPVAAGAADAPDTV
ncbi:hypothetical protein AB0F71_13985 [Kitasatospora sp. NPDC028055]|uniref:hypothetical protein n=1 Tax=Kitasatospora sp. NPDC028055 TaxID=3155653 RepID=UPI0033DF718C